MSIPVLDPERLRNHANGWVGVGQILGDGHPRHLLAGGLSHRKGATVCKTAPAIDWVEKLAEAIDVEPRTLLVPPEQIPAPNKRRKKRA